MYTTPPRSSPAYGALIATSVIMTGDQEQVNLTSGMIKKLPWWRCDDDDIWELKQTRRRRKRERHLKMWLRVSAIICQLFRLTMLEKCVPTILELNWNQRLGHKKTKLKICHHMLTSSTQLQNRSFSSRRRKNENVFKMSKDEKYTCKGCKNSVFHCQICKFVGFLLPSSSCLLKLPIVMSVTTTKWWHHTKSFRFRIHSSKSAPFREVKREMRDVLCVHTMAFLS